MLRIHFLLIVHFVFFQCDKPVTVLDKSLKNPNPQIQNVLGDKNKHEVQILLSEIKRKHAGEVLFKESTYQLDEERYFYPASTAKLPIAILALQKLNSLKAKGIPISGDTPFYIRNKDGETIVDSDSTQKKGVVTVNHLIKKIFLVSDNDAYNYLFDFLGTDYINRELIKKGLNKTQINHKFLFGADNQNTWEYTFFGDNKKIIYYQPSIKAEFELPPQKLKGVLKGIGYVELENIIYEPMNFEKKNRISIRNLEGILKRIIFPEAFQKKQRFNLTTEDYNFLKYWMSRTTLESNYPDYNSENYWDSYGKFFIYGDKKNVMTPEIRIYNKVGYAYGTITDVAYIKDKKNEIEFFLTATILVNENKIFNDDIYESDQIGIPFLAALGRAVLEELKKDKLLFH